MSDNPTRRIVLRGDQELDGRTYEWAGDTFYSNESTIMLHGDQDLIRKEGGFNPKAFAGRKIHAKRFDATNKFEKIDGINHEIFQFVEVIDDFIPVRDS